MGTYAWMAIPRLMVNGRGVWRAVDGSDSYVYFGSNQKWLVSSEVSMRAGTSTAVIATAGVEPDALTPDQVKGAWRVFTGKSGAWAAAPRLRVRQVRLDLLRTHLQEQRSEGVTKADCVDCVLCAAGGMARGAGSPAARG
jgi:hypothetical protein